MAVLAKVLIPAKAAENAQTTQYTAAVVTIIDKFTAVNYGANAVTLSVNIVTSGSSAASSNLVVKTKTLQPAETYTFPEVVGHSLAVGDFISTIASAATSIAIRSTGRQIS